MNGRLSPLEKEIIVLIKEGLNRYQIAEKLGYGGTTIRRLISGLCEHYQCRMDDLPEKTKGDMDG